MLEEGGLPHDDLILVTTYVTIGLSVLAHGLTAAPLANRYATWYESHPRDALAGPRELGGAGRSLALRRGPLARPRPPRPRLSGVPRWLSKRVLLGLGGAVLIVATFAFLLPKIADYRDVWGVVKERVVGVGRWRSWQSPPSTF